MSNGAASRDLYLSAYKNKDNTLRIVVINNGSTAATANIHCKGLKPGSMRSYTTSAAGNLQPGDVPGNTVVIPPRSVVTLTGNIKQ